MGKYYQNLQNLINMLPEINDELPNHNLKELFIERDE